MITLLILLFLTILLVYIAISNSLIYIALRLVTGRKFKEKQLILPSFLNFILILIFIIASYFILSSISLKGVSMTFMNLLFKATKISDIFTQVILPMILIFIILFILSTFTLLTVNIDYTKIKEKIKSKLKKASKKQNKEENLTLPAQNLENDYNDLIVDKDNIDEKTVTYDINYKSTNEALIIKKEDSKITYLNSLVANIFIISLVIFTITVSFSIGYLLSDTIMKLI